MILSVYVARRFLRSLALIGGVFLLILFLIEMIETIRRFAGAGLSLAGAARLSLLNVAGSFYQILPLVTVLAAIALFLGLARGSEMVAMRASGRSTVRLLIAPALTAAAVGAVAVAVLNPFVAATGRMADAAVARIEARGTQTVSLSDEAVWLRQGLEGDGQVVIRAGRASPDATTLYDATFLVFAPGGGLRQRIEAREARLTPGTWALTGVRDYPLDDPNPQAGAAERAAMTLPSDLTAQGIREGFGRPEAVPIWHLPAFVAGLERAGFSAARHRVWFQMELARPALMAAMVLVAAAFTMRHLRGRGVGGSVLLAFGAGVGVFFLRNLAQVLGDTGEVVPALAAWAPPAVAAALAMALILQREDG